MTVALDGNEELQTGAALPLARAPGEPGTAPVYTRDGGRLLVVGDFGVGAGLYALHPDGSDPLLVAKGATAAWGGAGAAHPVLAAGEDAGFLDR